MTWIGALLGSTRIDRHSAGRPSTIRAGRVPVATPLPKIPRHVEQPIAVRRKRLHGGSALKAVRRQVLVRKISLPNVRLRLIIRKRRVAPNKMLSVGAATRRELPLGFG